MKLKKIEKTIQDYKLVYYVDSTNKRQGELKQYHLKNKKLFTSAIFLNDNLTGELIYYNDKGFAQYEIRVCHNQFIDMEYYNNKVLNIKKLMNEDE